ncbi:MAG: helix-turn-helix domain-containing protein [Beijerinckiaceae bacterium]
MTQGAARAIGPGAASAEVPVFRLYGEAESAADAEFLHIEPLQARSERHGWEIARHTHRGLFQAVFLTGKFGQAILDNRVAEARAPCVIVVPPGVVHAFNFEPGTAGYVLTLAAAWTGPKGADRASGLFDGLMAEPAVVDLAEDAAACVTLLDQLMGEIRARRPGYGFVSEWLAASVLMMLARRRMAVDGAIRVDDPRTDVFARFRMMVEEHFIEHWPVSRYAQALATSESRLDRICRSLAGHSAFEVIQNRVLLEARRKLVHVGAPVSALAYELGFEDPAYFCRFFKRHTGRTPSEWRREQRERLSGLAQV